MGRQSNAQVKPDAVSRRRAAGSSSEQPLREISIDVECAGEWMPADELLASARSASANNADVDINLHNIHHLDASALQILLALDMEQKRCGQHLRLTEVSPQLLQWLELAGAAGNFSIAERSNHD
jgi:anti-anti-sigma regulatory factor